MKKIVLLLLIGIIACSCYASTKLMTSTTFNMTAQMKHKIEPGAGNTLVIYSITARTGGSGSLGHIAIAKGNERGVTGNFTRLASANLTALNANSGLPVFVGQNGYSYRIDTSSATNNTLIVTYGIE